MVPLLAHASAPWSPASRREPLPLQVPPSRPDALELTAPSAVRIQGWLGQRIDVNSQHRLLTADVEPFLAGFRKKPGSHPWIGEHVGKWIHATTLAWAHQGHGPLRTKLDQVVQDLIATQEADGYLGTYLPEQRFGLYPGADWDVWSHKYNLIGLLTYHRYTGDASALRASCRMADLLVDTFPLRRSILAAGTHQGLAATSVLEPIVLLYRLTAQEHYLRFARYIVSAWDEPGGPALVRTLLVTGKVSQVNPPKAYEMLSNLVGLVELARVNGEDEWIKACLLAWQDIVDRRLYLTGGTSQDEHFKGDLDLKDDAPAHVSEVCVTTTWIQFNMALLQLTGEARFAQEIERTTYNHLTAAQHPLGDDWCYFTPLQGRKRYLNEITCCHSSGPRGIAMAPQVAYLKGRVEGADALVINTFEPSGATLALGGQMVTVELHSDFPHRGGCRMVLRMSDKAHFALKLRQPEWAERMKVPGAQYREGWWVLPARSWRDKDSLQVTFSLQARVHQSRDPRSSKAALAWGPFVLAYEDEANPALAPAHRLGFAGSLIRKVSAPREPLRVDVPVLRLPGPNSPNRSGDLQTNQVATLMPYADAGAQGGSFRVWLRAPGRMNRAAEDSLLLDGVQSCSRGPEPRHPYESINDDDLYTGMSTFDGKFAEIDWFAVTLDRTVRARQFAFTAGVVTRNGGWFDASAGKPQVQIRAHRDTDWQTIGRFDDYPQTTGTEPLNVGNDWDLTAYRLNLSQPVEFVAVRVIGRPAGGADPSRPYVTCAELQAFT